MGVVSLVPSVKAMLKDEFPTKDIVILGAGGIVNGEGVAAVMALGKCSKASVRATTDCSRRLGCCYGNEGRYCDYEVSTRADYFSLLSRMSPCTLIIGSSSFLALETVALRRSSGFPLYVGMILANME